MKIEIYCFRFGRRAFSHAQELTHGFQIGPFISIALICHYLPIFALIRQLNQQKYTHNPTLLKKYPRSDFDLVPTLFPSQMK